MGTKYSMPSNRHRFYIGSFILTFLALSLLRTEFSALHSATLSYRDFKVLLKAGKVVDLSLGERTITGRLGTVGLEGLLPKAKIEELQQFGQETPRFTTVKLDDVTLIPELEAAGVQFQGQVERQWFETLLSWIILAMIFVTIWRVLMQRMGMGTGRGLLSIGKSKAKVYVERVTGVTFDDVAGIDEARAELQEIVDFLRQPERYRRLGGKLPKVCCWSEHPGLARLSWPRQSLGKPVYPS